MSSLTADVLNDLQRNNNPNVFGLDGHGNQTGSNQATYSQAFSSGQVQAPQYNPQMPMQGQMQMPMQGQMQMPMQMPMQGQQQGQMGNKSQVNPALVQEFINIVKNVPALSQHFSNQETFNAVMNNPGQMMEIVSKYQQSQTPQIEAPAQPVQLPQPMPVQTPIADQSGGEGGPEETDMNINEIEPLDKPPTWYDMLFNIIKYPLILTIIFMVLSYSKVKDMIFNFVPKLKKYEIPVLGLIFFALSIASAEILKSF